MDFLIPLLAENDEEILIFDEILNTKNRNYHYLKKRPSRFYKADIRRMVALFQIPEEIILKNRIKLSGEEGLCILLRRLAYPNRYAKYF